MFVICRSWLNRESQWQVCGSRAPHCTQPPGTLVSWKNSTPRYVGNSAKHCLTGVTRSACPPPVANVHPKPCTLIKGKQSLDHDGFVIAMPLRITLFRISQVGCRQWAAQAGTRWHLPTGRAKPQAGDAYSRWLWVTHNRRLFERVIRQAVSNTMLQWPQATLLTRQWIYTTARHFIS
jgi:hypothetical protein